MDGEDSSGTARTELPPVQQHRRGEGERQAEGGGAVEALAPPEEGGDRVQQQG